MKKMKLSFRKIFSRVMTLGVVSAVSLGATPSFAQKYSVTVLNGVPGGNGTYAYGINNANEVVGSAVESNQLTDAVTWNGSTPTVIHGSADQSGTNGGYESYLLAINNSGVMLGGIAYIDGGASGSDSFARSSKFVNTNLYFGRGGVSAINDSGEIVGYGWSDSEYFVPAMWANPSVVGGPTSILPTLKGYDCGGMASGINDAGTIVGNSVSCAASGPIRATRWSAQGAATDLGTLGGAESAAYSINTAGYIVGWAAPANNLQHAVVWGPTTKAFDLGTLGGKNSFAGGINEAGDVVGSAQTSYGVWHAVIWTHKHYTAVDLNSEIDPKLAGEITLVDAIATNDKCRVLASGFNNKTQLPESYLLSLTIQANCNE